ncbi:MAG: hypothetical protein BGO14_09095 [Chlamydiales bacterium 38-26]|nr:M56 family metallopeptidase [Chlamydiales bacterium]OJV11133.1 MAG: hypothetical protein BGO14_09095 [Chlamydiales bacterium 38-26]
MSSNPFFLLPIISSSFLAFIMGQILVEGLFKVVVIKNYRARAMLRLLPFFSLIVDLFFSRLSLSYWLNPFNCSSCVQKFILDVFFPLLKGQLVEQQISLVTYLGANYQHHLISILFYTWIGFSFLYIAFKCIQSIILYRSIKSILMHAEPLIHPVQNSLLAQKIKEMKTRIYLSEALEIPIATYFNTIVIPYKSYQELSPQEFEVVIAHELEHLKYNDPFVRQFYHLLATFFWWIPLKKWMEKIEQDQEMACDQNALKYGFEGDHLASAIFKTTKQLRSPSTFCYFNHPQHPLILRLNALLNPEDQHLFQFNILGLFLGTLMFLVCVLWL